MISAIPDHAEEVSCDLSCLLWALCASSTFSVSAGELIRRGLSLSYIHLQASALKVRGKGKGLLKVRKMCLRVGM